jgi:hypothetical protein
VNFRKGFFEKDVQAVIFDRPDIQKIVGVSFQLIIREIDLRHSVSYTGQAGCNEAKIPIYQGTKKICHKGTKTQRIYLLFFLRALAPLWQNGKSFVKKIQNSIISNYDWP